MTTQQKSELLKLYIKDDMSIENLALHFNCSRECVVRVLNAYGYKVDL